MECFVVAIVLLGLALAFRFVAGRMDRDRIRVYVESRGGRVVEATWAPFGPGWFGSGDRIYEVRFVDGEGNLHHAHCKTNTWTGVYFTEDRLVSMAEKAEPSNETLEEQNRLLRAEIERLRTNRPQDEAFRPSDR
ncbi:MAG: hypothetical protein HY040_06375 [Planctomycetes bacterium]|nr:hypothetical protein [Planctomycetota bacterium]